MTLKRSELLIRLERLRENAFFLVTQGQSLERQAAQMEEELKAIMEELNRPAEQPAQPYDPAAGLARSYDRDGGGTPAAEMSEQKPSVQFSGDPLAPSLASAVTPKQIGMIRALAREAGVDYEVECQEQLGCRPEELGKRAASAFIDYLKVIQEQGADFRPVNA